MQALSAAVGRSLEETALLIHLVLKEIAYRDSPKGTYLVQYCRLYAWHLSKFRLSK